MSSGGIASAVNAGNVSGDIDDIGCNDLSDNIPEDHPFVEICNSLKQMRNSQAATAVSFINYTYYTYVHTYVHTYTYIHANGFVKTNHFGISFYMTQY